MSDIERTEFELPGSSLPTPRPEPGNQPAGQQPNNELSGAQISGDTEFDSSLRPKSLTEFIGQPKVRQQLELVLGGARSRGVAPDHVLLAGPPGLGKTTMK